MLYWLYCSFYCPPSGLSLTVVPQKSLWSWSRYELLKASQKASVWDQITGRFDKVLPPKCLSLSHCFTTVFIGFGIAFRDFWKLPKLCFRGPGSLPILPLTVPSVSFLLISKMLEKIPPSRVKIILAIPISTSSISTVATTVEQKRSF